MNAGTDDRDHEGRRGDGAEPLALEAFLPYRLATLSNRVSRAIAALYSERFGISIPEWRVMAVLGERPEISANAVAERTAMDKVAVSRAVRRLLAKGLIERHFAPDDRRRSVLALSAAGRRVYDEIVPLARAFEARLLAALTHEERAILSLLLAKLEALPIEELAADLTAAPRAPGARPRRAGDGG